MTLWNSRCQLSTLSPIPSKSDRARQMKIGRDQTKRFLVHLNRLMSEKHSSPKHLNLDGKIKDGILPHSCQLMSSLDFLFRWGSTVPLCTLTSALISAYPHEAHSWSIRAILFAYWGFLHQAGLCKRSPWRPRSGKSQDALFLMIPHYVLYALSYFLKLRKSLNHQVDIYFKI